MGTERMNEKTSAQLVDDLIRLDRLRLQTMRSIGVIQAELQGRGLSIMEDKSRQFCRFYGSEGTAAVTDRRSLDILNPDRLKLCVSEGVYRRNVTETTETKYKLTPAFETMLKALFAGDYTFEYELDEFVEEHMHLLPDAKQAKTLLKKLKGDYEKDRKTLNAAFAVDEDWDAELLYIHQIINGKLIRMFLPDDMLDASMAELKKCVIVESKTAISLDYKEEKDAGV